MKEVDAAIGDEGMMEGIGVSGDSDGASGGVDDGADDGETDIIGSGTMDTVGRSETDGLGVTSPTSDGKPVGKGSSVSSWRMMSAGNC